MTRSAAFRASILFAVLTILSLAVGLGSRAVAAEALFMIGSALAAVMLFFSLATPSRAAVPVRVRRAHPHR